LDAIQIAVKDVNAKLVVIDPLMAYLGSETDSYRDQDVRRSLAPLASLARELEIAILLIRHLNKNGASNPIYRGGGSIGIIGAARSGLLVTKDPDDESKFILSVTKTNIAKMPPSLSYSVKANPAEIPFIVWHGVSQHTAASILSEQAGGNEERSAVKDAEGFLEEYLMTGARDVPDIFKEARKAGIAEKTLRRAKSRLGIKARKSTFKEGWVWELTKMANSHEDGQEEAL
jgi:hypothetical protein